MKIAIIGPRVFPTYNRKGVSGIEKRTEAYIKSLAKNHKIFVFIRNWAYEEDIVVENIIIKRVFTIKNLYLDTFIYSILATIGALWNQCDIFMYEGTGATTLAFLPKLLHKKVIISIHTEEWKREKWNRIAKWYLTFLESIIFFITDNIITVSHDLQKYILKKYNKKSIVIPYYYEKPTPSKENAILKKYNLHNRGYLLFLGRLTKEKRIDWLIKAYNLNLTDKKLVIAGDNDLDIHYVTFLKKLSKNNSNIIFTGYVDGKAKEVLLQYCFLFILPSSIEGLSLALLEAMSYQRPILASNLPQHRVMLQKTEYLFNTNSYSDFLAHFQQLLQSKQNTTTYNYLQQLPSLHEFQKTYETLIKNI